MGSLGDFSSFSAALSAANFLALLFLITSYFLLDWALPQQPLELVVSGNGCTGPEYADVAQRIKHIETELKQCQADSEEKTAEMAGEALSQIPGFPLCKASDERLKKYYGKFKKRGPCPNDWPLGQQLMMDDMCLQPSRRWCHSPPPPNYVEPLPYPDCLWMDPDDGNVDWTHYHCDSYACLSARQEGDCLECFTGADRGRWDGAGVLKQPTLSDVFALKPGTLRLVLDVGGGTGSLAALCRERHGATVVTTGMNTGAPFLETVALRGLLALHLSPLARLPFFDGTFDLIHAEGSVNMLGLEDFEFLLFDWDRVLRPGGLIWFKSFQQPASQFDQYLQVIQQFQYRQHHYIIAEGEDKKLVAVLEKPRQRQYGR